MGLVVACPFVLGDWSNLAANGPPGAYPASTIGGAAWMGVTADGPSLLLTAGDTGASDGVSMSNCPNSDVAMTVICRGALPAGSGYNLAGEAGPTGDWNISSQSGSAYRFEFNAPSGNIQMFGGVSAAVGGDTIGASVGPALASMYLNGALLGTTTVTSTNLGSATTLRIGQRQDGFQHAATWVSFFYKWNRQLSNQEVLQATLEPYSFLMPEG